MANNFDEGLSLFFSEEFLISRERGEIRHKRCIFSSVVFFLQVMTKMRDRNGVRSSGLLNCSPGLSLEL